ncbi:hemolysin family protein [Frigidibacter sp. SD6-1]|uniref:hemolysin family protein n=1 Tax=Frigidibacter sp. SD6-1 TaxID=3032581 RepID=UPI0024DFADBA|nr:hemolysin family protein [Frigidibacter sp. SD6-1]
MLIEILTVLCLTVLNGLLAMSELAIVSARPTRLKVLADQGRTGARTALALQEHPGRFLSAVQIGITLVGILSGAISGATLGLRLTNALEAAGFSASWAQTLGVGSVVAAITYLSLIVGELVPKQIALKNPEGVAIRMAPPMRVIAAITTPLVWFLDISGKALLFLLRQHSVSGEEMTDEEVKLTIAEAETAGVLSSDEREMIAGVMRLADRSARTLMTPRTDVEVLDITAGPAAALKQARETGKALLPATEGGADAIIGVIPVRDLLLATKAATADLRKFVREAPIVIDVADAAQVIEKLRESTVNMVLVFDEYGHFEGVITPMDVLEGITGSFDTPGEEEPDMVARDDGSFLVSGSMAADEFGDRMGLKLPDDREYETVAGLVLDHLGHIPKLGEKLTFGPLQIEVIDLDGFRIDKLLVRNA